MGTDRDQQITEALTFFQQKFRLTDWDIRYTPDNGKKDRDAAAQTDIRHYQRSATIRVDEDVDGDYIDRVIVHELTHLMLSDLTDLYNHTISKTGSVGTGIMDALADMIERICEQNAEAFTGVPWQPMGKKNIAKHPSFVNHAVLEDTQ